jgi:hypothetical protein
MNRLRYIATVLVLAFGLIGLFAAGALAAEGIGPAKKLGGTSATTTTTSDTSTARPKTGGSKETLSIATKSPISGTTLAGSVVWEASVLAGAPSKVEFAIDGSVQGSDSSAPFAVSLDTTKLTNGSHSLSATAYGLRGIKATTKVTVMVANTTSTPDPDPTPEPEPTPEPTPEPEPAPAPAPTSASILWGATIGSHLTGNQAPWDMGAVTKFEDNARKKASMVQFFQPFANCNPGCSFYKFPTNPMESIRQHGSIPVLSWSSQSIPSTKVEPDFQLSDVISGRYDTYIREFATQAKAWNHPYFLRFNWEMNGSWFPWHEGVNGNLPGESAKAWRHVHDLFTAVGSENATWVWCPNVEYSGSTSLASLYPGDSYVDWTCLDGYNWGTNPAKPDKWKSFDTVYKPTYQKIVETIAPGKPMMIGEVASTEYGGSKAAWIKDMLAKIPTDYKKIRALLWFDKFDSSMDWPVETSTSATAAWAEGLQSSAYLGNAFADLSPAAIQPQG